MKPILYNQMFGDRAIILRPAAEDNKVYTRETFLDAMRREAPALRFRFHDDDIRTDEHIFIKITGVQIHQETTRKLIVTGVGKFESDAALGQPVRFVYDTARHISGDMRQHWAANGYMSPFEYEAYIAAHRAGSTIAHLFLHAMSIKDRLKELRARLPF